MTTGNADPWPNARIHLGLSCPKRSDRSVALGRRSDASAALIAQRAVLLDRLDHEVDSSLEQETLRSWSSSRSGTASDPVDWGSPFG